MAFPSGYTKYQNVTIDRTKCGSADSTDFPAYINLADLVKAGNDLFDTCRSDGGDIRATSSDGTTQLPTQLVTIDTTAKTGELWVKVPTLSVSSDTVIRIWYNGSDTALARNDTYGSDNVWDSNYKGVWHLNQDPSGSAPQMDSSLASAFDGTSSGSMTSGDSVSVKIGNGLDFDGTDDIVTFGDTCDEVSTGASTVEFWARFDALNNVIFKKALGGAGGFQILSRGDNLIYFEYGNSAGTDWFSSRKTANTYVDATIRHYVCTFAGTGNSQVIYVNNTPEGSNAYSSVGSIATGNSNNLTLSTSSGGYFDGLVDEVRVSNVARSTSYITSCYNNQNSPSTFYSVGNEIVAASEINVSDTITITENLQNTLVFNVSASDTLTITEFVDPENALNTSVFDLVTITESADPENVLNTDVFDAITLTEFVDPEVIYNINVFDSIGITESVTIQNTQLGDTNIDVFDSITITESTDAQNTQLGGISIFDSPSILENLSTSGQLGEIIVHDSILEAESVSMLNNLGDLNIIDTITLDDSFTDPEEILSVFAFDSLSIVDNTSYSSIRYSADSGMAVQGTVKSVRGNS